MYDQRHTSNNLVFLLIKPPRRRTFGQGVNHTTLLEVFAELLLLALGCLVTGHLSYISALYIDGTRVGV